MKALVIGGTGATGKHLVQDLLHKIPLFKKKKNLPGHRVLRWLKFVVLGLFVILLPMTVTGTPARRAAPMPNPCPLRYPHRWNRKTPA